MGKIDGDDIAKVAGAGGVLTVFLSWLFGKRKSKFEEMEKAVKFWQTNFHKLTKDYESINKKYDELELKYQYVISQNKKFENEIQELRDEIKILKRGSI